MKPIIIEMNDMSDSTEVYESRPNPILVYTIYAILLLVIVAFVWMLFSKIEIVVKSNGMFRCDEPIYEVSSGVTGKIQSCYIKDAQLVSVGDVLFTVDVETLGETIRSYQSELENTIERLEILEAYEKSIDNSNLLDSLCNNKYYLEFVNRRKLLFANIDSNNPKAQNQVDTYKESIDTIMDNIQQYEIKMNKLEQTKSCITSKVNEFGESDSFYGSMVTSYIANYNLTASQYDTQLSEYQKLVDEYDKFLKEKESDTVSQNEISKDDLKKEKDSTIKKISSLKNEKEQALSNLELQQISSIEQQIESINNTILSLKTNLTSTQLQIDSLENQNLSTVKEIQILTEKGSISTEILSYQSKVEECKNYLKKYNIQDNNCRIIANTSGYFYLNQELKQGSYIQEGTSIGKIYPKETKDYYAEIYVENSNIAKLELGQDVKFEIAAYPSIEYGYFIGTIESISKDISIEQGTGSAYYLVKVTCKNVSVQNKNGERGYLMNGMACQAMVIVDEENVLNYLLKKIDLLD